MPIKTTFDASAALQNAIDNLSPRRREIFILRYVDNLSIEEIATRLDLTKNYVKHAAQRAKVSVQAYVVLGKR